MNSLHSPLRISTDPAEFDVPLIHSFLSTQSAWAAGISYATVAKSIANSLCFGGYLQSDMQNDSGRVQVAFARVVTDRATFAYLTDVFVLPAQRGRGYSKALMRAILAHPDLQGLRRFLLASSDARGLYAQFGFAAPLKPEIWMERFAPDVYSDQLWAGHESKN